MFRDSREKKYIREKLWFPIVEEYSKRTKIDKLRYLCLPGAKCLDLRYFVEQRALSLKNVVAIECESLDADLIIGYLSGQGALFEGKLEDIISKDERFIKEFDNPFHIINLDYYGTANSLGLCDGALNMMTIRRIIKLQSDGDANKFGLILTFNSKDKLNNKKLKDIFSWIKKKMVLRNYNLLIKLLNSGSQIQRKIAKVVTLEIFQVMQIGHDNCYDVRLYSSPMMYTGEHVFEGKPYSAKMISFVVEFAKQSQEICQFPIKRSHVLTKRMDEAIELIKKMKTPKVQA